MFLFFTKLKKKKICKLVDEVFHNFYNDGRLCGAGVKDKGRIEDCRCYNINTKNCSDVTYKMTVNDGLLRLTFEITYNLKDKLISVWAIANYHENQKGYKKYVERKYDGKPFKAYVSTFSTYDGISVGMSKMPARNEAEICEALHKFRTAWQESDFHKFLTLLAITDYTYKPKDYYELNQD